MKQKFAGILSLVLPVCIVELKFVFKNQNFFMNCVTDEEIKFYELHFFRFSYGLVCQHGMLRHVEPMLKAVQ